MGNQMSAYYAPWDTITTNLIGTFASEREALLFVRHIIEDGQRDLVEGWALGREESDGGGEHVAFGAQFVDAALALAPA